MTSRELDPRDGFVPIESTRGGLSASRLEVAITGVRVPGGQLSLHPKPPPRANRNASTLHFPSCPTYSTRSVIQMFSSCFTLIKGKIRSQGPTYLLHFMPHNVRLVDGMMTLDSSTCA